MNNKPHRSCLTDANLHSILSVSTAQSLAPNINELAARKRCQTSGSGTSLKTLVHAHKVLGAGWLQHTTSFHSADWHWCPHARAAGNYPEGGRFQTTEGATPASCSSAGRDGSGLRSNTQGRGGGFLARFPGINAYQTRAAEEPGKLKAPVLSYVPITRGMGFSNQGFPPVPPLEQCLASVFGVEVNPLGGKQPTPPSPSSQMVTRLADRSHNCAAQAIAAANNIALLSHWLNSMTIRPDLPADLSEDLTKASSTLPTLSAAVAVAKSRITAWQTHPSVCLA
ncbi:unnamed protein product [Pleuronectes platessa]|uniref:Uncharacterized protein n=1 Tax=Pleuronectes platessa TaxID=8262 RepID=A0A9N7UG65_PLEPL|nr:unnamed protein product [Pleuronectes platessa]